MSFELLHQSYKGAESPNTLNIGSKGTTAVKKKAQPHTKKSQPKSQPHATEEKKEHEKKIEHVQQEQQREQSRRVADRSKTAAEPSYVAAALLALATRTPGTPTAASTVINNNINNNNNTTADESAVSTPASEAMVDIATVSMGGEATQAPKPAEAAEVEETARPKNTGWLSDLLDPSG